MRTLSRDDALNALKEVGCPQNVIEHCIAVSRLALRIGRMLKLMGFNVDLKLVEVGALLHDIGRAKTHDVTHGVVGAKLVRELGFPESVALIVERHVGAGIPADEAEKIGLPVKDYIPTTMEEKIVAYADKLIDGNSRVSMEETIQKFAKTLGPNHSAIRRLRVLHEEFVRMLGGEP